MYERNEKKKKQAQSMYNIRNSQKYMQTQETHTQKPVATPK